MHASLALLISIAVVIASFPSDSARLARWRFGHAENGLRRQIFVGNTRGLLHWGLRGTQLRDIAAVETCILKGLRSTQ